MICPKCGCFITENNKKCWNCGAENNKSIQNEEKNEIIKKNNLTEYEQLKKSKKKKYMNDKVKMLLVGVLLILILPYMYAKFKETVSVNVAQEKKVEQQEKEKQAINNELMKNIKSRYQLQNVYKDNKQKLVIYTKNGSNKYFSGNLSFTVYDQSGHIVNNLMLDNIIYTNVPPNVEPYQIIWIKPSINVTVKDISWTNIQFTDKPLVE